MQESKYITGILELCIPALLGISSLIWFDNSLFPNNNRNLPFQSKVMFTFNRSDNYFCTYIILVLISLSYNIHGWRKVKSNLVF